MSFVLINHACDGTYTDVFITAEEAITAMVEHLGFKTDDWGRPLRINRSYISDWGNRLIIEERDDGWSAELEDAIREAFDARECGIATPEQLKLLADHNF